MEPKHYTREHSGSRTNRHLYLLKWQVTKLNSFGRVSKASQWLPRDLPVFLSEEAADIFAEQGRKSLAWMIIVQLLSPELEGHAMGGIELIKIVDNKWPASS